METLVELSSQFLFFGTVKVLTGDFNVGQTPRHSFMSFHRTFVQDKTNGGMKYWNKHARENLQKTTTIGCMAFHPHAFVMLL
eukprot:5252283-Karenia_brevis.AAC.1